MADSELNVPNQQQEEDLSQDGLEKAGEDKDQNALATTTTEATDTNTTTETTEPPLDWIATLPMVCTQTPHLSGTYRVEDALQFIQRHFSFDPIFRLYFPLSKYNSKDGFSEKGDWPKLLADIKACARTNGFDFMSNGSTKRGAETKFDRKLMCTRGRIYYENRKKPGAVKKAAEAEAEAATMDESGNPKGKPIKTRKSFTKLPLEIKCRCKMFIIIKYDDMGFYVVNGKGRKKHCGHAFVSEEELKAPPKTSVPRNEIIESERAIHREKKKQEKLAARRAKRKSARAPPPPEPTNHEDYPPNAVPYLTQDDNSAMEDDDDDHPPPHDDDDDDDDYDNDHHQPIMCDDNLQEIMGLKDLITEFPDGDPQQQQQQQQHNTAVRRGNQTSGSAWYDKLISKGVELVPLIEAGAFQEGEEILTILDSYIQKCRDKIIVMNHHQNQQRLLRTTMPSIFETPATAAAAAAATTIEQLQRYQQTYHHSNTATATAAAAAAPLIQNNNHHFASSPHHNRIGGSVTDTTKRLKTTHHHHTYQGFL